MMKSSKEIIKLYLGNITTLEVDAIVNAADMALLGGDGVDGAIHAAAGVELLQECQTLNGCETGEAKITKGYNLPANHVIHTVGPIYGKEDGREAELLAQCYTNSLKLAMEHGLKIIAFPAISTGVYGYPKEEAANVAITAVQNFFKQHPTVFDKAIFVLHSQGDYELYQSILTQQ